MKKRKGLSPVIATLFLIMLTLILASIVFLWAKGFIKEQIEKFDKPIDQVCENIVFSSALTPSGINNELQIEVVNKGNVPIYSFSVKKSYQGNDEFMNYPITLTPGESKVMDFSIRTKDNKWPEQVIIYPVIIGKIVDKEENSPYTCLSKYEIITPQ